jgi:TolB protein
MTFDQAFIEYVDVSPDGERLLVSSDRKGNQDLWMLSVEAGEMTQITTDPTPDWSPSWSPDGQEIAFYSYRSGNRDIWAMPANGGPARQLTHHEASDYNPAWSPDGEEIAFASLRTGNDDIWIVGVEGGEPRQMTIDPEDDNWPRFSPDGKWVVFASWRGGTRRLWQVPRDGGQPELIEGLAGYGKLSRDGKEIYFVGSGDRAGNLWAFSVEDGTEYPVTNFEQRRGNLSSFIRAPGRGISLLHLARRYRRHLGNGRRLRVMQ